MYTDADTLHQAPYSELCIPEEFVSKKCHVFCFLYTAALLLLLPVPSVRAGPSELEGLEGRRGYGTPTHPHKLSAEK
jgi:hypothetical protein